MRRYNLTVNGREFNLDVQELGPDRFHVDLNGERLEVELRSDEDVSEGQIGPAIISRAPLPPVNLPEMSSSISKPAPLPAVRPAAPAGGGSLLLKAPMPGVIFEVTTSAGAWVTRGHALVTLEAMKMKNAIRAPRDGVIAEVLVQAGQNVGHGEALIRFEEQAR